MILKKTRGSVVVEVFISNVFDVIAFNAYITGWQKMPYDYNRFFFLYLLSIFLFELWTDELNFSQSDFLSVMMKQIQFSFQSISIFLFSYMYLFMLKNNGESELF